MKDGRIVIVKGHAKWNETQNERTRKLREHAKWKETQNEGHPKWKGQIWWKHTQNERKRKIKRHAKWKDRQNTRERKANGNAKRKLLQLKFKRMEIFPGCVTWTNLLRVLQKKTYFWIGSKVMDWSWIIYTQGTIDYSYQNIAISKYIK